MEQDRKKIGGTRAPTGAVDSGTPKVIEDSSFALLRDNVSEALRILMLRRWSFFIPFCIVTCIAAIASHRVTRTYESRTVIERRDHPVLMNLQQTAATGGYAMFFRPTLARDVRSAESMGLVVENLGLAGDLERNADGTLTAESRRKCLRLGAELAGGVTVSLKQKADHFDQIEISFSSADPNLPQKLVSQIKDVYVAKTGERLTEMLHDVTDYFRQLADDQWEKKGRLEEDLLTFQATYIGVDPTDPSSLKLKLNSLESEQSELIRTIESLQRELLMRRSLRDQYALKARQRAEPNRPVAGGPINMAKSKETLAIEEEVRSIQSEIHELQLTRRMTDKHPDIVERRKRITRLKDQLRSQYKADAERIDANKALALSDVDAESAVSAVVGWNAETAALEMQIQDREARLAASQERLRVVDRDLSKHQAVLDNVFKYRKEFLFKKDKINQALEEYHRATERVAMAESILNADESERGITFAEITSPTPCTRPVRPRSTTVLALVLLVGLAAGAIGVLLKELFDHTYRTTKQVTRSLGLGILESIDEIITSADRARQFRRKVFYAPVTVSVLLAGVLLTCAAAYESVEHPDRYERIMQRPRAIWKSVHQKWIAQAPASQDPAANAMGDDAASHEDDLVRQSTLNFPSAPAISQDPTLASR